MLCLGRKIGEKVVIVEGDNQVILTVLEYSKGRVRLGFEAAKEVTIHRLEVYESIQRGETEMPQANSGE